MDEPCSALDPIATLKIEELIDELKQRYTIVIVTHNMQQAARVADTTAFMLDGELVEHAPTEQDLHQPGRPAHRGVRHREVRLSAMPEHGTRQHFHDAAAARSRRQALGGLDLVVEQLDRALEALEHQDVELAAIVIADDDRIDGRYLEVHQGILSLLALQAPVAGDLRLVAALLHVIKHVERMGDQCVNIAKLHPAVGPRAAGARGVLEQIAADGPRGALGGRAVASGLRDARRRRSPRTSPARTARSTASTARSSGWRSRSATTPTRREWAMHMMLVARALERIGDNAVDIGEQTAFVVTGLFREFSDASRRRTPAS